VLSAPVPVFVYRKQRKLSLPLVSCKHEAANTYLKNFSSDLGFLYRMMAVRRLMSTPHASTTASTSALASGPLSNVRVKRRVPM